MDFRTIAQNISEAARGLGLVSSDISDPFTSTDPNILQLVTLGNDLGIHLLGVHPWMHLQRSATATTSNGVATVNLETNLHYLIDGSFWNNTTDRPVVGPISPAYYQELLARTPGVTGQFFLLTREAVAGLSWDATIYPTPTSTQTLGYRYVSNRWTGNFSAQTRASAAADVVAFDSNMFVRGLKLFWKRAKGYDVTAAQIEFDEALDTAKRQEPAQTQCIVPPGNRPSWRTHYRDKGWTL